MAKGCCDYQPALSGLENKRNEELCEQAAELGVDAQELHDATKLDFGEWTYCRAHLAPHQGDWCTVDAKRDKVGLGPMKDMDEATEKCRHLGLPLYGDQRVQHDLAYLTECELATLTQLQGLKSSSRSRVARQAGIVEKAVAACKRHKVNKGDAEKCPRLYGLLFKGEA